MPELIGTPSRVEAAGTKPKLIDEFVGRVNTGEERLSVARMNSPQGWVEPGQRPDFDEWTLVLDGTLTVEHEAGVGRRPRRAGRSSSEAANGCATRRPTPVEPSTSPSACRPSRRTRCTATTTDHESRRAAGEHREDAQRGRRRRRHRHLRALLRAAARRRLGDAARERHRARRGPAHARRAARGRPGDRRHARSCSSSTAAWGRAWA